MSEGDLLARATVAADATLRDALAAIDRGAVGVCLVVDAAGTLIGLATDGDVRRAQLAGRALADPLLPHATRAPVVVDSGVSRAHVLDIMRARHVSEVPVVDGAGHLVGLHTLGTIVGRPELPNVALIMAGGRGTRLGELTRDRPKPLMTVAGRAILDWILLNLSGSGVRDVFISVNYLGRMIEEHVGDGSQHAVRVRYLREQPDRPLGTAGSLALLRAERPGLTDPLLVVNGDLMVQFSPASFLAAHERARAAVTVATRSYEHQVPYGVVETDDRGMVVAVREKPTWEAPVNAGLYVVSPAAAAMVPADEPSTMPGLVDRCLDRGLTVATWMIESDWVDVGTPADLGRARGE